MGETSLLFRSGRRDGPGPGPSHPRTTAEAAHDLRLDELARALEAGREGAGLGAVLLAKLDDPDDIEYRHEVFRDLGDATLHGALLAFEAGMRTLVAHESRAVSVRDPRERLRWQLAARQAYLAAVDGMAGALTEAPLHSRGLLGARGALEATRSAAAFGALRDAVERAADGLDAVRYRLRIGAHRIIVDRERDEPDLGAEVRVAFARFGTSDTARTAARPHVTRDLDPIEAAVLERVARLHPAAFAAVETTVRGSPGYLDPAVAAFGQEIGFYLGWLELVAPLQAAGLALSYPRVIAGSGEMHARGLYDLALARDLVAASGAVVTNDVDLTGAERRLVVTGPSQGGKTTLARAIGQLHHLSAVGCPVPASDATVPLVDAIHTRFDRGEEASIDGGRLEGDLRRIAAILDGTGPGTLVVLNETFPSTTVDDALELSRAVLDDIAARGARCVVVTFLDELAADPGAVSLAAVTRPDDPERRTFRFERRAADGLAHAQAVALRHGLAYNSVRLRLRR